MDTYHTPTKNNYCILHKTSLCIYWIASGVIILHIPQYGHHRNVPILKQEILHLLSPIHQTILIIILSVSLLFRCKTVNNIIYNLGDTFQNQFILTAKVIIYQSKPNLSSFCNSPNCNSVYVPSDSCINWVVTSIICSLISFVSSIFHPLNIVQFYYIEQCSNSQLTFYFRKT